MTDIVILTVSNGVLSNRQIDFSPALPEWKLDAIEGLPLGSHTRVAMTFGRSVLRELPAHFTVNTSGDGPIQFRNQPFGYEYVEIVTGGRMSEWMEKSGERPWSLHLRARCGACRSGPSGQNHEGG